MMHRIQEALTIATIFALAVFLAAVLTGCQTTAPSVEPITSACPVDRDYATWRERVIELNPGVTEMVLESTTREAFMARFNAAPPRTDIVADNVTLWFHPPNPMILVVASNNGCIEFTRELPIHIVSRLLAADTVPEENIRAPPA